MNIIRFVFLMIWLMTAGSLRGNDSLNCAGKSDKEGRKHGVWVCRNNEGKLMRKERYKHGEVSTWTIYDEKGQMIESRDKKGKIRKYKPCGC